MATKLRVTERFGVVPQSVLLNKKLSLRAKGLFAYIQSKPDGWDFSADRIALDCKEERKSILSAMRELETNGYLLRKKNKDESGKWYWEHQLTIKEEDTPESAFGTTAFTQDLAKPESALRTTEIRTTNKDRDIKIDNTSVAPSETTPSKEEKTNTFNSDEWIKSLSDSTQPHIRLIAYYFGLYSEHNFPTKKVAEDEMKKNLKPAVYLLANYDKKEISRTLKYCKEHFSEVSWNLNTVKKQISYVTAKKD